MKSSILMAGREDALRAYGVKQASARDFLSNVLQSAKLQLVGQPTEALRQIRAGELFHPEKGLYTHGLPKTTGQLLGALAIPAALAGLTAAATPKENRGELVGNIAGQFAGSMLGGPLFGSLGQLAGGAILSNLGGAVGGAYDRATRDTPEKVLKPDVAFVG